MPTFLQLRELRDALQAKSQETYPDHNLSVQVDNRSQRMHRQRSSAESIPMATIYHHDPDFFADGSRRQGYYRDRRMTSFYFTERLFETMTIPELAEFVWTQSRELLSSDTHNPVGHYKVYNVTRNGRRVLTQYPDGNAVKEQYSLN